MATVLVLCGIIGHFIGSTDLPSRRVCSTLYPAPRRRFYKSPTSDRIAAKLARRTAPGEH